MSGSKQGGQHNHAALVVGKEDAINRIYNNIRVSPIHMSEISERKRRQVLDNLDVSSSEIGVWCFHIGRQKMEADIQDLMRERKIRKPRVNVHKSFDVYWYRAFRRDLEAFAARFKMEVSEIVLEADADMRPTLTSWNIDHRYKGRAYELADAIAWFNQRKVEIPGCRMVDLRSHIFGYLERGLLKWKG